MTFSPPHISIYDLNIENGTVFKKLVNLGKLKLPSDEEAFRNSESTHLILKTQGIQDMKSQTIASRGINRDIIEFIGVVQAGGVLVKVPLVHLGGGN